MEITPQDILAAFGAIVCIGGGVGYIVKFIHWIMHPNDIQNKKLKEHDEILKKHSEYLENDNTRITEMEEQDRLVMQALFALLSHGIDSNHTEEMKQAREQIQKYLISK